MTCPRCRLPRHRGRAPFGVSLALTALLSVLSHPVFADPPPFDAFVSDRVASISNDSYGATVYWRAGHAPLRYPGRVRFEHRHDARPEPLLVILSASCRADAQGRSGTSPRPMQASLTLPMHPDDGAVPSFFSPRYWWRVFTDRVETRTPVTVTIGDGAPHRSALYERHVDWSFARPDIWVWVPASDALRALAAGVDTRVTVVGEDVDITLRLGADRVPVAPARAMARHCVQ